MNIKDYCIEISKLLKKVDEQMWRKEFDFFINEFDSTSEKSVIKKLRKIYGGLGSFNDLVLYKNGQICFEENEKLDKLRAGLFEELKKR